MFDSDNKLTAFCNNELEGRLVHRKLKLMLNVNDLESETSFSNKVSADGIAFDSRAVSLASIVIQIDKDGVVASRNPNSQPLFNLRQSSLITVIDRCRVLCCTSPFPVQHFRRSAAPTSQAKLTTLVSGYQEM